MLLKSILILLFSSLLVAKTFTVSYDPDYAPFSYSVDKKPYGIFIDIWKLWAKKNNNNIKFVRASDWDDALELVKDKKVDFFLGTTPYSSWMQSSLTYYKTKTALYFLKSFHKKISTIGIIGDDYKKDIKSKFSNIKIISFNTYQELLEALIKHKVDAIYDDTLAISYYAIKNRYNHSIKTSKLFFKVSDVKAISADKNLIKIFNKTFKKIKLKELEAIEGEWISNKEMRYYNNATFLKKRSFSYVYDPDWKPFEYRDDITHTHAGIIADLLSLVASKSGLSFYPVSTNSWAESVKLLKEHKVDMVSAVPWTKQRAQYLQFTKRNIYSYPAVLVSNKQTNLALNENFSNITIGIVKENSLGKWIEKKYPKAHFIFFKNVKDGFEALKQNKIDFFGINGISANYYINVMGFSNSHIYTILDYMFHLKIAFLKNINPEVLTLIDEALSKITDKEASDIYHKWTSIRIKKEINYKLIFTITTIALVIVLIFIFINKRLNRLVQKRTTELKELNENLEDKVVQRTKELALINKKMYDNIEYASLIQNSILPQEDDFKNFFHEHAIIWQPKDIVGGDIYLFHKINEDEALLFIIDCTGHGVSGAFVTMLVKAIEEQILVHHTNKDMNPKSILQDFNNYFQKLITKKTTRSNIGFDAAVLLINKKEHTVTYAGANIALYYIKNNELNRISANHTSIGYKKSKTSYNYKEHSIKFDKNTIFYISTDGFIDQNGGTKGFPFGKKRFKEMLMLQSVLSLEKQKDGFEKILSQYRQEEEQTDDITLIALKIF